METRKTQDIDDMIYQDEWLISERYGKACAQHKPSLISLMAVYSMVPPPRTSSPQ